MIDSSTDRHIVQVLNENETKMLATILAVEPSNAVIVVGETPANAPQPIRYWYQSGRTLSAGAMDCEFVYPRDQATRIAKSHQPRCPDVDTNASDIEGMMRGHLRTVDPNGAVAEYRGNVRPQARSNFCGSPYTGGENVRARIARWRSK